MLLIFLLISCNYGYAWNATANACQILFTGLYGVPCYINSDCNATMGLVCPNKTGTCNCPLNSSSIFCDCPTGYYYNYSTNKCGTTEPNKKISNFGAFFQKFLFNRGFKTGKCSVHW